MGKKDKGGAVAEKPATIVGVAALAKEFDMDPKKVRKAIRDLGHKAPPTNEEGFGPKAKYEWAEGSKELKEIRAGLQAVKDKPPAEPFGGRKKKSEDEALAKKEKKKSKPAAEAEEAEDADDDDDSEDDDDEDGDDE